MTAPTAPGVYVSVGSAAPSPNLADRTGTSFVTGEAQEGPVGVAIPITSMQDYANYLGGRAGYTELFDALNEYFQDGGSLAYVSRIIGPSAVNASVILTDRAESPQNTLKVEANGGGVWANQTTVAAANGSVSNTYTLTITDAVSGRSWTSPNLTDPADAVTWATNLAGTTPWVFPYTIINEGSSTSAPNNNPATGTFDLSSGADDLTDVTETQWTDALTAFLPNLGPGQVWAPGHNTEVGWQALIAHASALDGSGCLINNRVALLDDSDSSSASTVISQVAEAQGGSGDSSYGALLAPWVVIPGVPPSVVGGAPSASTRTVPPSSLVAALMAASDASHNAGVPAAGANGQSSYATGVTQSYVESDRGLLDQAGVSVIRQMGNGAIQLYGYKTIATNPAWVSLSFARLRMQIVDALNQLAQPFAFRVIDGKGHLLSAFNAALSGYLQDLAQAGALFPGANDPGYEVNTGPSVNTPVTIQAGQLNAVVSVRMSPYAEFVQIAIVQNPVTQSLAA